MHYIFPQKVCNAFFLTQNNSKQKSFIQTQLQVIKKYEFTSWKYFSSVSRKKKKK